MQQSRKLKRQRAVSSALATLIVFIPYSSIGGEYDGWCFPANDCTGEPSPIRDGKFSTCEELCEMTNPTKIGGLDASIYSVSCDGDHLEQPSISNRIFTRYKDSNGTEKVLALDGTGVTELTKCTETGLATPDDTLPNQTKACPLENSVWRSGTASDNITLRYTSKPFFFLSGPVSFERWIDDIKQWTVTASIECSNGVPFCHLILPLAGKDKPQLIPLEMVTPDGQELIQAGPAAAASFAVFPHLRLSTYRWINYSVEPIRVASQFEAEVDQNGDVILPSIYTLSDCAR
ncbi:hypothetical protein ABMA32_20285 [Mesorhizobium sp. VNQ89]|uniref:hypothetical protein n=1 Tax=Mesorhizobium quangtriensis TaxID=3157709 RepID=UPI0032B70ECD